jgi:tripartite-type tricarboxylate transporter receptor subunit TctC
MQRRQLLAALGLMPFAGSAVAQTNWPDHPVRFVNPFSAGSAVDVVTRLLGQNLSERLGQQFVVENRTGASGSIGTEAVAKARPDGYTLLVGSPGTMAINPYLFRTLPYDAEKDFVALSHAVSFPQAIVVNPKLGIRTLAELVARVKAEPGKLNYGSSGSGTTSHLAVELFKAALGLDMVHVPFRGGSQAVQAVIGGEIQVAVEGVPSLPGLISQGLLLPLAVTSAERSALLPDVPAIAETVPGFDAAAWIIYFAPAGTPAALVDTISSEMHKSLHQPDVRQKLLEQGATIHGGTAAETAVFHRAEMQKWKRAVEISGAKVE